MKVTRRELLGIGGGLVAALSWPGSAARANDTVEIEMAGRSDGSRVWFDPIGIRIQPGQTIRWINRDKGNAHTTTAYHPANFDRPRRIPQPAEPWDSDYLLPGESFSVKLTVEGVYDYYCVPHEHAGMVGRIIVGRPGPRSWMHRNAPDEGVPEIALRAFPAVDALMGKGIVRRAGG